VSHAVVLFLALVLDAILGEPDWVWKRVPHPTVVMGKAIEWLDETFNEGAHHFRKGALGLIVYCAIAAAIGWMISYISIFGLLDIAVVAIFLAHKSLTEHVQRVADTLRQSTGEARKSVAMIVGRDTADMTDSEIARAAIESAAENFSDGVVAPAFWFLVAGLPGLLVYKLVNTADSMIGYRTERHVQFGKFAARLDDVLNWVPARLTALILTFAHRQWNAWRAIFQDAPLHRSPNAGWPEAAMAVVLNVTLSGPRAYEGEMRDYPWVNAEGVREIDAKEVDQAVHALWSGWFALLAIVIILVVVL